MAEYDIGKLAARAYTLNAASGGRFILGVGTGQGSGSSAVERLVVLSNELRASYPGGAQPPTVFFSALRAKMTRAAFLETDGVILNFCTPSHTSSQRGQAEEGVQGGGLRQALLLRRRGAGEKDDGRRVRALQLDCQLPQALRAPGRGRASSGRARGAAPPEDLLEISMYDPSAKEVERFIGRLVKAGVDIRSSASTQRRRRIQAPQSKVARVGDSLGA